MPVKNMYWLKRLFFCNKNTFKGIQPLQKAYLTT